MPILPTKPACCQSLIPCHSPLPVIIPVVLVQNARVWEVAPCFSALLDVPAALGEDLRPFIPDFVFALVQLAALPFAAIRGTPAGILTLRVMKAEREGSLLGDEVWDENLMIQVSRKKLRPRGALLAAWGHGQGGLRR